MIRINLKLICFSLFMILLSNSLAAQEEGNEEWRENFKYLIYSPRYFGPNAFPQPELLSVLPDKWEAEVRGEYHYYTGDKTKDLFLRLYIPFVKGRVGVEATWVASESYEMDEPTRKERWAVERKSGKVGVPCHGDVIFTTYFQLLQSDKIMDILASASLKSASGNRSIDARYTDAASYWFTASLGRQLIKSGNLGLRVQVMGGFYCWMTNSLVHRQNDAVCYSAGIEGLYRNFLLTADFNGLSGYKKNGDRPQSLRFKLEYELKNNVLSFRYRHGMKDNLYDSYSLAYIRRF